MSRAVVVAPDRTLVVEEMPNTPPPEGEVSLAVSHCGICGSDLHLRPVEAMLPAGSIMGHEFSATIVELGAGVEGFATGERVCVFPATMCGECEQCSAGRPQLCQQVMQTGVGLGARPGGYAEFVSVPAQQLFRLPDAVSDRDGALVEPVAVAMHILDTGGVTAPGDTRIAVIGGGPIGALTAACAKALGGSNVVLLERNEDRAQQLRDGLGLEVVSGGDDVPQRVAAALGGAPQVVLEAAGHESAPQLAVDLVDLGGVIVLAGVLFEPVQVSQLVVVMKEAQLRGAFFYKPSDFDAAIELLASGNLPTDGIVTDVVGLEAAEESFAELLRPGTPHLKIMLKP